MRIIPIFSYMLILTLPLILAAEPKKQVAPKVAAVARNAGSCCNTTKCEGCPNTCQADCKCGCQATKATNNECTKCSCSQPKPTKAGDEEVCTKCGCQIKPTKDTSTDACTKCSCSQPKPTK